MMHDGLEERVAHLGDTGPVSGQRPNKRCVSTVPLEMDLQLSGLLFVFLILAGAWV